MEQKDIFTRAESYIREEKNAFFRNEVEKLLSGAQKGNADDQKELKDRFYQNLEFGTGGLRGVIGGGTNRMNTLVINKATQGLANYFVKTFPEKARSGALKAVVCCDSRHYSPEFAEATALIFAGNGFTTYLFTSMRPTPELSFAVRILGCDTGVVVTASHNPPKYNGYKAYWNDGAQVIPPHDEAIIAEVNAVKTVKTVEKAVALQAGTLKLIDTEIDEKFHAMIKASLFRPDLLKKDSHTVKIVYTPLHGTGAMHVEKVLGDLGLKVVTVPEQREGDGNFPTVEKPNPEEAPAMKLACALGKKEKADVVMATDPDADRFGVAVPDKNGDFVLVTGNQMGALFTDYICLSRKELGIMPKNPAVVRSIVTTTLSDRIAKSYGVDTVECLTGFKWIASVMERFLTQKDHTYIFGYEESYGYTVEDAIRDKDGVSASAMCAEMTLYWRSKGKSLLDRIEEIYTQYGYYEDASIQQAFPGPEGGAAMAKIMETLRKNAPVKLGDVAVERIRDLENTPGLPKSNVLQFFLVGGTIVSARPSGTEPKIKFYINCTAADKAKAASLIAAVSADIKALLDTGDR